jgi:hypothetical protein
MNGEARAEEHAVAADLRAVDSEAVACATRKARNKRIVGVTKLVLPRETDLRNDMDGSDLPIVRGFRAKGRAKGFLILTRIGQRGQRTAFAKVAKAEPGYIGNSPSVR